MSTANLTASGQSIVIDLHDVGTVVFCVRGTYAGFAGAFEVCPDEDGLCWFPVFAARSDSNSPEISFSGLTNITRLWRVNTIGMRWARLRCTGLTSGTVVAIASVSAQAIDPAPSISMVSAIPAGASEIGYEK